MTMTIRFVTLHTALLSYRAESLCITPSWIIMYHEEMWHRYYMHSDVQLCFEWKDVYFLEVLNDRRSIWTFSLSLEDDIFCVFLIDLLIVVNRREMYVMLSDVNMEPSSLHGCWKEARTRYNEESKRVRMLSSIVKLTWYSSLLLVPAWWPFWPCTLSVTRSEWES